MARTLLCIDDQEMGLKIRTLMLERQGYHVHAATTAEAARVLLEQKGRSIDLIVLDYNLRGERGDVFCGMVRTHWPWIRILMLSGFPNVPDEARACVDGFVTKGQPPSVLFGELERLLGERPERPESHFEKTEQIVAESRRVLDKVRARPGRRDDPEREPGSGSGSGSKTGS